MRKEEVGKEIDKRNTRNRKDKEWEGGRTGRGRGKTGKEGSTVEGYSSSNPEPDLGWWEKKRGVATDKAKQSSLSPASNEE